MKTERCLYFASFSEFLLSNPSSVLGELVSANHGMDLTTTIEAWEGEIRIMQDVLAAWQDEDAYIIFEYSIPRLGKRVDVVLLLQGVVFCIEFKVGKKDAIQEDLEQVLDYALDLKNFHLYSADKPIAPILVPTNYTRATEVSWGKQWTISPYAPTPTIIEAARTLYENHSVEDITRHEADKVSTDATIDYILQVIRTSKERREKSICFVTGVPGAGKTLVGLDVAIKQSYKDGEKDKENGAVYLSGNGPLVAVLTEALAVDNQKKCKDKGEKKNLSDSRREVSEFLQIIHRYRDNMLAKIKNPVENGVLEIDPSKAIEMEHAGYGEVEHVAIFDEAQRTWTHERLANYLKRGGTYGNKLKVPNFPVSEAAFLIWSLDQRKDWAVIICLVGGGQEINTGEAGISEWIDALNNHYPYWKVYISNKLTDVEYAEGKVNQLLEKNCNVVYSDSLHSFRSEKVSIFVNQLLALQKDEATMTLKELEKYPIVLTRNLETAKQWLRDHSRGSERMGLLASSKAERLKAIGINVRYQPNFVHWFLEDKTDIRSSNYLEEAATEIQVQGLELDYACVLWDADMRCENNQWEYYKFNGKNKWNPEKNEEQRKYMLNAYRVLLTRARQGIVICVPEGNSRLNSEGFPEDATRLPEFYDGTYEYLRRIGIKEL